MNLKKITNNVKPNELKILYMYTNLTMIIKKHPNTLYIKCLWPTSTNGAEGKNTYNILFQLTFPETFHTLAKTG